MRICGLTPDRTNPTPPFHDAGHEDGRFVPDWSGAEYEEVRVLARSALQRWGARRPLDTTELVHEGFLRLSQQRTESWGTPAQYFAAMVVLLRRALIDAARRAGAGKRGGDARRVALTGALLSVDGLVGSVFEIDDLLRELAHVDEEVAEVASWRVFAGCPIDRIAVLRGVSKSTAERRWRTARAWLAERLRET